MIRGLSHDAKVCFYFLRKNGIYFVPLHYKERGVSTTKETYTLIFTYFSPRKHPPQDGRREGVCNILTLISSCDCVTTLTYLCMFFFFPFFQVYIYTFFHLYLFSLVFPIYISFYSVINKNFKSRIYINKLACQILKNYYDMKKEVQFLFLYPLINYFILRSKVQKFALLPLWCAVTPALLYVLGIFLCFHFIRFTFFFSYAGL